jgi:methylated-DNA-[protein]-cysteine S-methyltransferase
LTLDIHTPLGLMRARASERGLMSLDFTSKIQFSSEKNKSAAANRTLKLTRQWLEKYFSGDFKNLPKIPLDPQGTDFQSEVWTGLTRIRPSGTASYSDLAKSVARPLAARAVGGAVGKNPILLIIPCHRILGKDKSLTGFSAGLNKKKWLLRHEGISWLS